MAQSPKPLVVLIAGPYKSGTGGDPELMARNLGRLEGYALPIYEAGHLPMIGEWVALPVSRGAGSVTANDEIADRFLYPVAQRLIQRCDAVLRVPGESKGADQDVALARSRGLPVFYGVDELPTCVDESDGATSLGGGRP